ncbi:MAG TPA: hypothetical protein VIM11_02785 [Tepidisphaeraceae bacterium]|jgi:hypothetical protein
MMNPQRWAWRNTVVSATIGLVLGSGCAQSSQPAARQVPSVSVAAPTRISSKLIEGNPGARVDLPHYVIYSTISDRQMLLRIGDLLESALASYHVLAPQIPSDSRPMECYIFENRSQWANFTKAHTGDDAAIYLRVNRGGYTIGDRFVAYWIGEQGTFSVAAHEGWHQYVARHLKGRLPPFLEEGLACLFEQVQWEEQGQDSAPLPRFNLMRNHPRLTALRAAADGNELYPLANLVTMHAGQVVGRKSAKIEAFYAQSWAFARFLNEAHPQSLQQMLTDASNGLLYADNSTDDPAGGPLWDPSTSKPMLEHYLQMSLSKIEIEFARYVRAMADGD